MDKKAFRLCCFLVVMALFGSCSWQTKNQLPDQTHEKSYKQLYLDYAHKTADEYLENLELNLEKWREKSTLGKSDVFNPGASEIYLAALFVNLYEVYSDEKYLHAAKTILLRYPEYKELFKPELPLRVEYNNGIPAVPNFFVVPKFARAAQVLFNTKICTESEKEMIGQSLAESADYLLLTQEWGAINRAALRAEALLIIADIMKNHPHRAQWFKNGKAIINDNLNNWSIEDAGMYNMIWLYSLCGYANYLQHEEIFENPVLNYYFEYNKQLYSPAGVIPDYGDAWWKSWWHLTMPVFEVGAKAANSKSLRWVAQDAMFKNLDTTKHNIDIALKLSEAYLWAGEQSQAEMPQNQSKQVLDDAIGKKIVFRSGWQPEDTYLLLNYRDETESGWLFKQNLYNTLSIEHEKIHHGHSDENSIVCWMYKGSLLLHDGGYRPALPSGPNGAYRADIFHNKPVLRKGLLPLQNGVIEQFKNDGYHEKVTTFKIDFITGKYADYSRTRTVDTALHIISDRTIVYCKSIAAFVVTDIVISTKNKNDVSAAVLWHTQTIKELGNNWFVGRYDSIGHWKSSSEITMFACFPNEKQVMQSENIDRHKQNEKVVSISRSQQLQQGESLVFHSVLIPVGEANYAQLAGDIMRVASSENAAAVSIKYAGKTLQIVHKIDLEADIARQWPRPRYQYQSGEIVGEKLRSDGHFLFLQKSDSVYVQALNCTAVYYNETCIFEQSKVTNEYRPDGAAPTADAWKVRMFEKTIGKQ